MSVVECNSCERIRTRDRGTAPLWDSIARTDAWDIVHAYDTSLLGWVVVVARRHIESIDELQPDEARELGELLRSISLGLKIETGCDKTYVMQFAEHPRHPHVHFHVVPRMATFPPENVGANVFNYMGVDDAARVGENEMNSFANGLRKHLA